jgi:hypothetical protein
VCDGDALVVTNEDSTVSILGSDIVALAMIIVMMMMMTLRMRMKILLPLVCDDECECFNCMGLVCNREQERGE